MRAITETSAVGLTLEFGDGLNIIRGANSTGKSQVVNSILWSLGMEAVFGPGTQPPLGSALTSQVEVQRADLPAETQRVVKSWSAIEIENYLGEVITVRRPILDRAGGRNLVHVWHGPAITGGMPTTPGADYFVSRPGAAENTAGFHRFLADYLGWDLPLVARYAGEPKRLYQQVLFAFFVVDQRSWGLSGSRSITQFQLREPTRRAVETLLNLKGPAAQQLRGSLESQLADLRGEWVSLRSSLLASAASVGSRVLNLPDLPAGARGGGPTLASSSLNDVVIEVFAEGEWILLADASQRLSAIADADITRAGPVADDEQSARAIREAENTLEDLLVTAATLDRQVRLAESQMNSLDRQIVALEEERQRNNDVKILVQLGSHDPRTHLADEACPTCFQSLAAAEADVLGDVLTVDQTLAVIDSQLATAREMKSQAMAASLEGRGTYEILQREIDGARIRLRAAKSDAGAPLGSVSTEAIAAIITAQTRRDELERFESIAGQQLEELENLASKIGSLRRQLAALPSSTPDEDTATLNRFLERVRANLRDIGFSSYAANKVDLDLETLRIVRSGVNLDVDVSASDVVRLKVSYLDSIRDVSWDVGGQHPGLLVYDEPRQHELEENDFRAMLKKWSAASHGQTQTSAD